jgi:hypothetical protein
MLSMKHKLFSTFENLYKVLKFKCHNYYFIHIFLIS